jgi:hypothetical protein
MAQPSHPKMDFSDLTFAPRDPTEEEQSLMNKRLPDLGPFKIMGHASEAYNCLGWAIQQVANIDDHHIYLDFGAMTDFMASHGFVPTTEPLLAVVDVWGIQIPLGETFVIRGMPEETYVTTLVGGQYFILHFSRKIETHGWTSNLGKEELIVHDRYDFLPKIMDGHTQLNYGYPIAHFMKKGVVGTPRTSEAEHMEIASTSAPSSQGRSLGQN